ncbi:hypothetical protein E4V42_22580 [Clostridium estertheticum]|uniref:Uncharacterized protein n=1 Tax=Clostridium estertheticum TaxID=238834 RepID=A0A5N7IV34_9CLOT|nr:hypothetical protein [Clostridium estertheticum]MPQ34175.1 hypothetical protein [Clostridium estertheticum]MPQ64907.1 hypothetical protein [Clostridium estertheticum]
MNKEISLDVSGMGIIMFSEYAVEHIKEGEDYFSTNYQTGEEVLNHVYQGTIVGFCTSSPGIYILKIKSGYPEETILASAEYKMRLGIQVKGGKIHFKDLFVLMDWMVGYYPEEQSVEMEDGYYNITMHSNKPESGRLGDDQVIYIYFNKLDSMPKLKFNGVPTLCE